MGYFVDGMIEVSRVQVGIVGSDWWCFTLGRCILYCCSCHII